MHYSLQIMFILPLMKATSFDRPQSWVAFIEGFHCISNSIFNLSISIPFPVLEFELSCNSNCGIELTQPYMQWLGTELVTSHYPNQWWPLRICCYTVSLSPGGRFKNTYELLNPRALKISKLHKNHIFQCMGKIFCVEFQRVPLKFHSKYLTHTLKDVHSIHRWKFKSSLI